MSEAAAARPLSVVQMLPALGSGGVERGTLEVACHLSKSGHRAVVIAAAGRLQGPLLDCGAEHLVWDVGAKRPSTLLWVGRLRRWLAEQRPDILHLRSRVPAWVGYLAWRGLTRDTRPALVTTVHGFYTTGPYSAVMTRGQRVIAISNGVRDYILRHYPRTDPRLIRVIHRGVDRAQFPYGYRPPEDWLARWRHELPQLANRYVVTLPARLTRWKGQEHFIEIIAALKAGGVPVHGLLAGGVHPRKRRYAAELRRKAAAAGLTAADFSFLGERSDLREVMAVSDAVVSLSLEPEAFGRASLEALSLGRPVAAYDHGGVGEQLAAVLPEGRVPVGDRGAMVAMLTEWRRRPPAVPHEHPFTLARMLDATLAVYRELAPGRGP